MTCTGGAQPPAAAPVTASASAAASAAASLAASGWATSMTSARSRRAGTEATAARRLAAVPRLEARAFAPAFAFGKAVPGAPGPLPPPFAASAGGPLEARSAERSTIVAPSRTSGTSARGLCKSSAAAAFRGDSTHFRLAQRLTVRGGPAEGRAANSRRSSCVGASASGAPSAAAESLVAEAASSRMPRKRAVSSSRNSAIVRVLRKTHSVAANRLPVS
mmetsp:Transcript_95963/g.304681  ORF Transcript_95963/g.304681 Transcript_95963/m.304681 type:complete len:219 (-) Transcript_95963:843-1499(-)